MQPFFIAVSVKSCSISQFICPAVVNHSIVRKSR